MKLNQQHNKLACKLKLGELLSRIPKSNYPRDIKEYGRQLEDEADSGCAYIDQYMRICTVKEIAGRVG